jgi:RNA polymerase sigma-70 factor (ECF subfamily)
MSPSLEHEALSRLLPGVGRGEERAVDRWYRAELPVVYRLAFGFLADAAEAQDLAQDAMLHLMDRLVTTIPDRYPAWRSRVVLNLCRDRQRRLDVRRRKERAAEIALPQRLPRPDDSARQQEVRQVLREALGSLTPREREVFVLRDLEGASFAEVAAILGLAEGTARTFLSLARRRLRNLLGPRLASGAGERGGTHG